MFDVNVQLCAAPVWPNCAHVVLTVCNILAVVEGLHHESQEPVVHGCRVFCARAILHVAQLDSLLPPNTVSLPGRQAGRQQPGVGSVATGGNRFRIKHKHLINVMEQGMWLAGNSNNCKLSRDAC